MLLVTFADDAFAQRRVGGVYRGGVVRRAAWGGSPGWRYRRAVVGAGLIGVGVGAWGYPGYGYGYGCGVTPRLVWNGWAWQQVLVQTCY